MSSEEGFVSPAHAHTHTATCKQVASYLDISVIAVDKIYEIFGTWYNRNQDHSESEKKHGDGDVLLYCWEMFLY